MPIQRGEKTRLFVAEVKFIGAEALHPPDLFFLSFRSDSGEICFSV